MSESHLEPDPLENIIEKEEYSLSEKIIMALTIFNIILSSFAVWLFLNFFSLMGKEVLSGTIWETIYYPVINTGLLLSPFIALGVHVWGVILLRRFGVLSTWWLMNYFPLLITLALGFFVLIFWIPPIILILLIIAVLALPLIRGDY